MTRRLAPAAWIALVAAGLGFYLLHMDAFTPVAVAETLRRFRGLMVAAWLAASILRAFFLIPATPFVIAGVLLLPDRPWFVFGASLSCVALSATMIYRLSDALGFRDLFERAHAPAVRRMEELLRGPSGFAFLVFWAFFPLAPTDAACYAAGTVRMPFGRFLAAVCLGEAFVCAAYVTVGRGILTGSPRW